MSHKAPELPNHPPSEAKTVPQVVVTFLYYTHEVNLTIMVELNIISA